MGMETILLGYITEPSVEGAPGGNTLWMRNANRKTIQELSTEDDWPPLARGMFAFSEQGSSFGAYRGAVIHLGGRFKSIEAEWEGWLEKYEALLARLFWAHTVVYLHTEAGGDYRFDWRISPEAIGGFLADPPRLCDRWEFEGPFRSWEGLLKHEASDVPTASVEPVPAIREPSGTSFSLAHDIPAAELSRALCKTASYLQQIEQHGATLHRFDDWWEHDGLHFARGQFGFSDLFRLIESPRTLLQATPDEECLFVGVGPLHGYWYLRFRLGWDDAGFQLKGRFDLTLPPEQAALYREEVVRPLNLPVIEQDAASYYRAIKL